MDINSGPQRKIRKKKGGRNSVQESGRTGVQESEKNSVHGLEERNSE